MCYNVGCPFSICWTLPSNAKMVTDGIALNPARRLAGTKKKHGRKFSMSNFTYKRFVQKKLFKMVEMLRRKGIHIAIS